MSEIIKEEILAQIELEEKEARLKDPEWQELSPENFPECYQNTSFLKKIIAQAAEGPREVLISDIDWTFYHKDIPEETDRLYQTLEKVGIPVCYCTGRDLERVTGQPDLPQPDLAITAVGTEIWVRQQDDSFQKDPLYRERLLQDWQRDKIYQLAQDCVQQNPNVLVFQDRDKPENQGKPEMPTPEEFKISLYFYGGQEEARKMEEKMKELFGGEIGIVFSTNWREENCFYVDILPKLEAKTGKAMPIHYLKSLAGFRSIVAGDGGNDADMLFGSGSQAIVVGNFLPEMPGIISSLSEKEADWRPNLTGFKVGESRNDVYLAAKEDIGPRAILKALIRGDFNPHFARKITEISS